MNHIRCTSYRGNRKRVYMLDESIDLTTTDETDEYRHSFVKSLIKDMRVKISSPDVNLIELDADTMFRMITSNTTRKRLARRTPGFMYFVGYSKDKNFIRVLDINDRSAENEVWVYDVHNPFAAKLKGSLSLTEIETAIEPILANGHLYAFTIDKPAYKYITGIVALRKLSRGMK